LIEAGEALLDSSKAKEQRAVAVEEQESKSRIGCIEREIMNKTQEIQTCRFFKIWNDRRGGLNINNLKSTIKAEGCSGAASSSEGSVI
jgi:hypothetical protein